MRLKEKSKGVGVLLARVDARVQFEVVCTKCHQPLTIVTILHFADCPQVSVGPCSCPNLIKRHEAVAIVQGMVTDTEHLVGTNSGD